jgi:hypothetical protein
MLCVCWVDYPAKPDKEHYFSAVTIVLIKCCKHVASVKRKNEAFDWFLLSLCFFLLSDHLVIEILL